MRAGDTWTGETFAPQGGADASHDKWVTLTSYGAGARPMIAPGGAIDAAIQFPRPWFGGWVIDGVDVSDADVVGIDAEPSSTSRGLRVRNVTITSIVGGGVQSNANPGTANPGYEVWTPTGIVTTNVEDIELDNVTVTGAGVPLHLMAYRGLHIVNSHFDSNRNGGAWLSRSAPSQPDREASDALIEYSTFDGNGTAGQDWGIAGLQLNGGRDIVVSHCSLSGTVQVAGSPDCVGIDLEGATRNVIVSDCTIENNAGAGVLVFDNTWGVPGMPAQTGSQFLRNTMTNNGAVLGSNSVPAFMRIIGNASNNVVVTDNVINRINTSQEVLSENSVPTNTWPARFVASGNIINPPP